MSTDRIAQIKTSPTEGEPWAQWYRATYPKIYYTVYRLSGGDIDLSEELAQEAFVKFLTYRTIDKVRDDEGATAYLRTMARHLYYDQYRKKKKERTLNETWKITETWEAAASEDELAILRHDLEVIATQLPEQDRKILTLAIMGESLREIAAKTGLTYSNVGVRLHRLKRRLTEQLGEQ